LERLKNVKRYNVKHLRIAHRIAFGPVYEWAGNIRTVNIRKLTKVFADKDAINIAVDRAFKKFYAANGEDNWIEELKSKTPEIFILEFAHLYNGLNLAHPFLEGNGRAIKIVLTAMVRQTGYNLKWDAIATKKWDFDEACKKAEQGDISKLAALFEEVRVPFALEGREPIRKVRNVAAKAAFTFQGP
jgi:cell filamentation protein